jgi:hypothetical protein
MIVLQVLSFSAVCSQIVIIDLMSNDGFPFTYLGIQFLFLVIALRVIINRPESVSTLRQSIGF